MKGFSTFAYARSFFSRCVRHEREKEDIERNKTLIWRKFYITNVDYTNEGRKITKVLVSRFLFAFSFVLLIPTIDKDLFLKAAFTADPRVIVCRLIFGHRFFHGLKA